MKALAPLLEEYQGYEELVEILIEALDQSAKGKGKERHAVNRPWVEQPIIELQRAIGNTGGSLFQVMKKCQESERLPPERAIEELKGAIIYAAAAIHLLKSRLAPEKDRGWSDVLDILTQFPPAGEAN